MKRIAIRVTTGAWNEYMQGPDGEKYSLSEIEWLDGPQRVAPFGRIVYPGLLAGQPCWILPDATIGIKPTSLYERKV